ncbi:MAG: cysteine--tRNA ligase [Mariprofundaceae bacterium]
MSLKVYNSLTRRKELFEPLESGKAGMYVCGVTVYDHCHVGHARVMVVFDVIYRWMTQLGFDVNYVRNFTDVDDKIIKRANDAGVDPKALTDQMIEAFHQDVDALNCLRPTHEPRATMYMDEIIRMISQLIEKEFAYVSGSGDVLYSVRRFDGYGQLSGKNIDDLDSGSRVEVDDSKHDPLDFVLWKQAKPGEPAWKSPWGEGRPGWHIECSAMSCAHLGKTFDIHGGGMDLKFPHHENEIAQARAANGGEFARYWLHNGFVNINEEKMSKSLGNFFTICEVLDRYDPEVLRMFILGTHYRSPLDFSDNALDVAKAGLDRLYETRRRLRQSDIEPDSSDMNLSEPFRGAMNDDFNTPEALAELFQVCKEVNRKLDAGENVSRQVSEFTAMTSLLGIVQKDADAWFHGGNHSGDIDATRVEALIIERNEARKNRNFSRADAVRDELTAMGIVLEDGGAGTTWKKL